MFGFRAYGFRVYGFRVKDLGFRVCGLELTVGFMV